MKKLFRINLILSAVIGAFVLSSFVSSSEQGYTVLHPHHIYCNAFYSMTNGVPILMLCSEGLCFNNKVDICDWPLAAHPWYPCNRLELD